MRPKRTTLPQGSPPMMLVIQCPVCTQNLIYRGPRGIGRSTTCPRCEAPLVIRNPQLGEQEILSILRGPFARA